MFVFIISLVNALDSFTIVTQTNVISSKDVHFKRPFSRVPNVAIRLKEPYSVYAEIHSISIIGFTVSVLTDESHLLHYEYFASLDHEIQCHSGVNGVVNASQPYTLFHMTHNLLFITETIIARGEYGFCIIKPPISENIILAQQSIELDTKGLNSIDVDIGIKRSVEVDKRIQNSLEIDKKQKNSVEVDQINHQSLGIINHDSLQIDKLSTDDQQDLQEFKQQLKQQIVQTILHLERSNDEPINTIDMQKILEAQQQEEQLTMVYNMQHQNLDLETDEIAAQSEIISYEFDPETQLGEEYDQAQFAREQEMEQKRIQAEQEELDLGHQVEEISWGQVQNQQTDVQPITQIDTKEIPNLEPEIGSLSNSGTFIIQSVDSETSPSISTESQQNQIEEVLYSQGFTKPAESVNTDNDIQSTVQQDNSEQLDIQNSDQIQDITNSNNQEFELIKETKLEQNEQLNHKIVDTHGKIDQDSTDDVLSNMKQQDMQIENSNNQDNNATLEKQQSVVQDDPAAITPLRNESVNQDDSNILIAQTVTEKNDLQIDNIKDEAQKGTNNTPIDINQDVIENVVEQNLTGVEETMSDEIVETLIIEDPVIVLGDQPQLDQFIPQVLNEEQVDSELIKEDLPVPVLEAYKEPLSLYIEGEVQKPIESQLATEDTTVIQTDDAQQSVDSLQVLDVHDRSIEIENNNIEADNTMEDNQLEQIDQVSESVDISSSVIDSDDQQIVSNPGDSEEINQDITILDVPQYEIQDVPRQNQISLSINLKNQPHMSRQKKRLIKKQHQQAKFPVQKQHQQIQIPNIIEQWAEQDLDTGVHENYVVEQFDSEYQDKQLTDDVQLETPESMVVIPENKIKSDEHQKPIEILQAEKEFQNFKQKIQPLTEVQSKIKPIVQVVEPKIELIDPVEHEKRKQEILEQIKHELQQHRGQPFKQETGQYALENAFTNWLHTERDVISDIFSHTNIQPESAFIQDREVENIYEQSLEKKVLVSEDKHPVTFLRYIRDDPLLDDNYSS